MVSSLHGISVFAIFSFLKHLGPPVLIALNVLRQLDTLATQHPEVCCRKEKGEASGMTYQVRNAAVLIEPALLS